MFSGLWRQNFTVIIITMVKLSLYFISTHASLKFGTNIYVYYLCGEEDSNLGLFL